MSSHFSSSNTRVEPYDRIQTGPCALRTITLSIHKNHCSNQKMRFSIDTPSLKLDAPKSIKRANVAFIFETRSTQDPQELEVNQKCRKHDFDVFLDNDKTKKQHVVFVLCCRRMGRHVCVTRLH